LGVGTRGMATFALMLLLSGLLMAQETAGMRAEIEGFQIPRLETHGRQAIRLWGTRFYVYEARAVDGGAALVDMQGKPVGPAISAQDWCLGGIQGTIRVGGATYNLSGTKGAAPVDCERVIHARVEGNRYALARGPYGDGSAGGGLVPWRTLAVDPAWIPMGTLLFVPEAVGRKMPNGQRHDGYFFAADTGAPIRGNHVDLFSGLSREDALGITGSDPGRTFKAYVVEDAGLREGFRELHAQWVFER
jgi:3D (Asp-Asp-Asp) domain-containing protein